MISKNLILISIGLILFLVINKFHPNNDLSSDGWLVLSLLILMALWWLTNAIPMSVTALLPLIIIPIFSEINISDVAKPYSNPIIFLLLGGFIIGLGLKKSNLHKRIAMKILINIGSAKKNILAGFMISTAFISMWLSNTATCLLMLPIAISVISKLNNKNNDSFNKLLLLSIAYSSSIGGMTTLIGTAPNAIFAGYMAENFNLQIGFINWMLFSFPLVLILMLILWVFISFIIKDTKNEFEEVSQNSIFHKELQKLGKITNTEKNTFLIILTTIILWTIRPIINSTFGISLTDASVSIFGASLFFLIPKSRSNFLLDKSWFKEIPWDILILFGGGLSLASLVTSSGLAVWISTFLYFFNDFTVLTLIIVLAFLISFLTEVTSNTATTLLFLPIIAAFATNNNYDIVLISLPIILASSCAFMMPVATPPNAIVFSTNQFKISYMAKVGFLMNVLAVILSGFWIYNFSYLVYG